MIPAGAYQISIARFLTPLAELLDDGSVSEIMINGPHTVWIERGGRLERTSCAFPSAEALGAALVNIAQFTGRPLGECHPILEAHLPDGSRVEAVLPPLAADGPIVAIRRFSRTTLTLGGLVQRGSMTEEAAAFLGRVVRGKRNIVISGGTGTGKTSLLGAIAGAIPENERIVVIEDTRELRLDKPHAVYLESRSADERGRGRVTIRDLLKATLRLRPDRIVVGEVRGGEALDLLQAMTSGHGGSLTTAHANTPLDALRRIETMALMDESAPPLFALRAQVASAVQIVVQLERTADGARRVSEVSQALAPEAGGDFRVRRLLAREAGGDLRRVVNKTGGVR